MKDGGVRLSVEMWLDAQVILRKGGFKYLRVII